uniref:Uncharacterized protein n=1 Tax=viral metagenome TaxID=1070528 RepID=A0A6M3XV36_9ZZZZ
MSEVQKRKEVRIEPVEVLGSSRIILANPNADREYEDTIDGRVYRFPPFKRLSVESDVAAQLMSNAAARKLDSEIQAEAEISDYYQMMGHDNKIMHLRAKKRLCDPDTGEPPRTKPWKRTPLVNLQDKAGEALFNEGIEDAINAGFEIRQELARENYREMAMPKPNWSKQASYDFLQQYGGSGSYNEPEERIYKKARRLFIALFNMREKDGFGVIDSETGKVVRREDLGLEPEAEDLEAEEG